MVEVCFNTSDVSVECYRIGNCFNRHIKVSILQMFRLNILFKTWKLLEKFVSILQMFRLNAKAKNKPYKLFEFQYFRCFGWIRYYSVVTRRRISFNTSDVSVECFIVTLYFRVTLFQYFRCFGWINVGKNLTKGFKSFNTSDVSVESYSCPEIKFNYAFQYFRCFGWILLHQILQYHHLSFNTSDVSVECFKAFGL